MLTLSWPQKQACLDLRATFILQANSFIYVINVDKISQVYDVNFDYLKHFYFWHKKSIFWHKKSIFGTKKVFFGTKKVFFGTFIFGTKKVDFWH